MKTKNDIIVGDKIKFIATDKEKSWAYNNTIGTIRDIGKTPKGVITDISIDVISSSECTKGSYLNFGVGVSSIWGFKKLNTEWDDNENT